MSVFLVIAVLYILFISYFIYKEIQSRSNKRSSLKQQNNQLSQPSISISWRETEYSPLSIRDVSRWDKYHRYKVKGKNPKTNRLKTCCVVAKEGTPEHEIALKSGFDEPFTVIFDSESYEERPPTEKQIRYAEDRDITIPRGCTSADVSCLISRQLGETVTDWIPYELYIYLSESGCRVSPYQSLFGGVIRAINALEERDSLAFFAYLIHCAVNSKEIGNIKKSKHVDVFYQFADTYLDDEEVWNALQFEETHILHLLEKKKFDGRNKQKAWIFELTNNFLSEKI